MHDDDDPLHRIILQYFPHPSPPDATLTCPANYTYHDDHCYRLMTLETDVNVWGALIECSSEGSMLAAPTTNTQVAFLQQLLLQAGVKKAGLGLSDR